MKAVNLLIESQLPEDIRDPNRRYDSKGIGALMADVASKHPDDYTRISKLVQDAGRKASLFQGETIGVEDLKPVFDKDKMIGRMKAEIERAREHTQNPEKFEEERLRIWNKYSEMILDKTKSEAIRKLNPIGLSVASGARGKAPQLQALLSTPGLYTDYKDRVIPIFSERSFSEGIRPADFLAGTFGTRRSVIATKRSTAMGGDYSKLLSQITAREVIQEDDCGTRNGIDLDMDDDSLSGRVLAKDTAGLPAGTVLDRVALSELRKKKVGNVIARSPMTCSLEEGLCSKCVGKREGNKFPSVGDHVGVTASNSIGAPIAQAALNCIAVGTEVRMADGSVKKIEDVEVGEFVLGADTSGNTFPVKVTGVWDQGMQPTIHYTYQSGIHLKSTKIHGVLQKIVGGVNGVLPAGYSADECQAITVEGEELSRIGQDALGDVHCWDLTVDHEDHLFVLANGLIVSNTKHTAGMSSGKKKEFSGFDYISQFSQAPENFPEGAILSEEEGKVERIADAEQGGKYVTVGGKEYYVSPEFDVLVTPGDKLERGDQISDGLVNPRDVIRLRGLGSARRYYADRLHKLLEDSGAGGNKRNVEIVAKAAMNHIMVDDPEDGDTYLPDDVVTYNRFSANYNPPADSKEVEVDQAEDKFLQQPTLHYTEGTRLTRKMIDRMKRAGIASVPVSDKTPYFTPVMSNLRRAGHVSDDWLAKQNTSYLAKNLTESAVRGEDTNVESNVHYAPRLAIGKDFGKDTSNTGKF